MPYKDHGVKAAYDRERYIREGAKLRALKRERHRLLPEQERVWRSRFSRHGIRPEDWAAMWDAQQGACYLCGEEMVAGKAVIDHDHSHCPPEQSCRTCRRGLACSNCNSAIGLAGDDPDQLRQMAGALEAAQLAVTQRMAAVAAKQLQFPSEEITR